MRRVWIFGVIFFLVGCSGETETRSQASSLENGETISPIEEIRGKALTASPHGPVKEIVDWVTAEKFAKGDPVVFPDSEREKLSSIRLPVLAPRKSSFLSDVHISHRTDWFALSSNQPTHTFYIRGSRLAIETTMEVPNKIPDVAISRTHGIVTASFRKFGVSYNMDVECTSPARDPLCADDDVVRELVESLVVYGGRR